MGRKRGIEPVRAMRGVESCRVPPSAFIKNLDTEDIGTHQMKSHS